MLRRILPPYKGILFFALTEITIGAIALTTTLSSVFIGFSQKPLNIAIFVTGAGFISICLGIGVLIRSHDCRKLLMFFAGAIVLSKVLISAGIMTLHGALETRLPSDLKNTVSIIYHVLIITYFHQKKIKEVYKE